MLCILCIGCTGSLDIQPHELKTTNPKGWDDMVAEWDSINQYHVQSRDCIIGQCPNNLTVVLYPNQTDQCGCLDTNNSYLFWHGGGDSTQVDNGFDPFILIGDVYVAHIPIDVCKDSNVGIFLTEKIGCSNECFNFFVAFSVQGQPSGFTFDPDLNICVENPLPGLGGSVGIKYWAVWGGSYGGTSSCDLIANEDWLDDTPGLVECTTLNCGTPVPCQ